MKTLGVYGYAKTDSRLARVMESGGYEMLWHFVGSETEETRHALSNNPPQIIVVNPAHEDRLGDYRPLVPNGSVLVVRAQPFGSTTIQEPLEVAASA